MELYFNRLKASNLMISFYIHQWENQTIRGEQSFSATRSDQYIRESRYCTKCTVWLDYIWVDCTQINSIVIINSWKFVDWWKCELRCQGIKLFKNLFKLNKNENITTEIHDGCDYFPGITSLKNILKLDIEQHLIWLTT